MFLLPGTPHYITWTKQNLLDTATYYPQAVIKDKKTDTTLATLSLASLGSDRYGVSWNVPQDPTGLGREISIVITIYEDSGHTVVSGVYGAWETDYTIYELRSVGNISGQSIDYQYLKKIIQEEIAKVPKQEQIDLSQLMGGVNDVKQSLGERIKEIFKLSKKADTLELLESRIEQKISAFEQLVANIKKELVGAISNATNSINESAKQGSSLISNTADRSEKILSKKTDEELTYIVSQFKKIMDNEGEKILKKLSGNLDLMTEQLSKPLTVSMNRDNEEKVDSRIKKLLPYVS